MQALVTDATFAPSMDGPQYLEANTLVEADADTVHAMVRAGKALYVNAKDDPTRIKQFTAAEPRVQALRDAMAAAAQAAKAEAKAAKAAEKAAEPEAKAAKAA